MIKIGFVILGTKKRNVGGCMSGVRFIEVTSEDVGQRIDNFLMRHYRSVPKTLIYRVIRKGEVRVNKGRVKQNSRLCEGDLVRVPPIRVAEKRVSDVPVSQLKRIEAAILYEDADLMVLNKPSGVAVHGGSGIQWGLIEVVRALRPLAKRLELVHRLDRDTSGCILLAKEVAEEYYPDGKSGSRLSIKDILTEGQELIIQVQKEERGNKGAALTTQITLAGPYVVMMPNNPKAGGISRRIEGDERSETRDALKDLDMPEGMGLIIRTAGVGKSTEELQWGVNYLVQLWEAIQKASQENTAPFLIHQESDIVILAIRDYLRQDISEIIIDDMPTYQKAREFVQHVMPHQVYKVKPYQDTIPLFTRFQVESQIETAYTREVILPSGGGPL